MRGFIASIAILLVISVLAAINSVCTVRAADGICEAILEARGEADSANALRIKSCIALVERKQKLLRVSLKANDLKEVLSKLGAACSHCLQGDADGMNACLSEALSAAKEWRSGEIPSFWNVL